MKQVSKYAYMENESPALMAEIKGSDVHPEIAGTVYVYGLPKGFYLQADLEGLPESRVFGFHIHDGLVCAPIGSEEPFSEAGGHFNNCGEGTWCSRHPYHAGDLPSLFSNAEGKSSIRVYIDKADIEEIAGKPIVIHGLPDDFKTQPSGNSGVRIACGILKEQI